MKVSWIETEQFKHTTFVFLLYNICISFVQHFISTICYTVYFKSGSPVMLLYTAHYRCCAQLGIDASRREP